MYDRGINPTLPAYSRQTGGLSIVRLSPSVSAVEIECRGLTEKDVFCRVLVTDWETGETAREETFPAADTVTVDRIVPGVDYIVEVLALDAQKNVRARSNARIVRCGYFPGVVVNYTHKYDLTFVAAQNSGRFVGSPHIVSVENDDHLIVSHDVFPGRGYDGQPLEDGPLTHTQFFESTDGGKHWRYLSEIRCCIWGTMFFSEGKLCMLGTGMQKPQRLMLFTSPDCGRTWEPVIAVSPYSATRGYRTSPTPHVVADGRVWFAIDIMEDRLVKMAVASFPLGADVRDPKNWIMSDPTAYDPSWPGAVPPWKTKLMEEGNLVIAPDGSVKLLTRFNSHRKDIPVVMPEHIGMMRFAVDTADPHAAPRFERLVPFNNGRHKFYIQPDPSGGGYWCLANRMTVDCHQREVVSLSSSSDLEGWRTERDVIDLRDMEWPEEPGGYGIQYPSFLVQGDTIAAVLRTAMNFASTFHDSNAMTFHRFVSIHDRMRQSSASVAQAVPAPDGLEDKLRDAALHD
jgi:hypothetical protein